MHLYSGSAFLGEAGEPCKIVIRLGEFLFQGNFCFKGMFLTVLLDHSVVLAFLSGHMAETGMRWQQRARCENLVKLALKRAVVAL
jgi:hypothetical protein